MKVGSLLLEHQVEKCVNFGHGKTFQQPPGIVMNSDPASGEPAATLRAEMARDGAIPFARFMELALYQPGHGYYERTTQTIGRRGDFFTSVSVGPLFGELLAARFAEWLEELAAVRGGGVGRLCEAGAHNGQLARDILGWWRRERPDEFARLEYCIVEPSAGRRAWQAETLGEFRGRVRWIGGWDELPDEGLAGIIFANELLDALPVRRLGWDAGAGRWFEWGVAAAREGFAWTRLPLADDPGGLFHPFAPPPELTAVLPDGFTTEVCPAAVSWWRSAARSLRHGKLLTVDYGLSAAEFFTPGRAQGTLRSYARHRAGDDLLADPGGQDLTAHVNFSAVQAAGEAEGLRTDAFTTQARFLTAIAGRRWSAGTAPSDAAVLRQFQTLTHPEHLGRSFSVLVQSRV